MLRRSLRVVAGFVALLCTATMFAPESFAQQGTLDKILREKKVKIGWSAYAPLMMRDPKSGALEGYFFDAARFIFKEVDVEPTFVEVTYANLIAAVQSGEIDLSIVDSFITIKRAAAVDFSRPLLFVGNMLVVRANETRFKVLEDLNKPGIKIASLQGGAGIDFMKRNMPNVQLVSLNTTNKSAPFMEVASGRVDAALNDAEAARRYVAQDPSTKEMLSEPFDVRPSAWMVKKGNTDLLNFINSSLDYLILSGLFKEMAAKYPNSGQYMPEAKLTTFP